MTKRPPARKTRPRPPRHARRPARARTKPRAASPTPEFFTHHASLDVGHALKPAVTTHPSPNHASRQGHTIDTLVLHNTDGPLAPSLARLTDPAAQVSAHYVVDRTGTIYQLVSDSDTAWHSGNKPVNQRSIGIEIVAWKTATGMTPPQEVSLVSLCRFILEEYGIVLTAVVPHRSIKATDCPGWVFPTNGDLETWKTTHLEVP